MSTVVFGLFGLIVGSFLNVVVIRHGVRSLGGRSGCMACGHQLMWYDMIPVLSWLMLRGKCRACTSRISMQYPLVEAATGILFAFVGFWVGSASFNLSWWGTALVIVYLCVISLLVAITVYDILHTIIPDEWAFAFAFLALTSQFLTPLSGPFDVWWVILAGPAAAAPLFALWFFSRGAWMGLGDAKLAIGMGWLLGPSLGIVAVFFAFVLGAIITLPLLLLSSKGWKKFIGGFTPTPTSQRLMWGFTMKSEIPFGPFLILSCIILWFSTLNGINPLEAYGQLVGGLL